MDIAVNDSGKVLLIGSGLSSSLNGEALTLHTLTEDQEAAWNALRKNRTHATFSAGAFTAVGETVLP